MSVATVLLVRWNGGYLEVEDVAGVAAWGRKEAFIQLGSVSERDEAVRVAQAVLSFQAAPIIATTLGIEPTGVVDAPYVDYDVGDTITAPDDDGGFTEQRVVSMTVAEDDNGDLTFANELKAAFLVQEEAFNRQLKKLLGGSMSGQTQAANPLPTGSFTRQDQSGIVGQLRAYVNEQDKLRLRADQTSANSNTQDGGTWTPGVDQPRFISESHVGTTGTGGSAGRLVIPFPDGGFDTRLISVVVSMGDVPGVGASIVNVVQSNTDKTQVDVVVVDSAGVGIDTGSVRVDYIAVGI